MVTHRCMCQTDSSRAVEPFSTAVTSIFAWCGAEYRSSKYAGFCTWEVQRCDAVQFIQSMHLRDPRVSPQFSSKPQRVIEEIWAWGDLPCDDETFAFDHLEVHTDGSAVLQNGWPAVPISAGWGAVFFAVHDDGSRRLLGALWCPADVSDTS